MTPDRGRLTAAMPLSRAHRFETLDGLRGVAALCVMAGHFSEGLGAPWWPPNLFLAVDVFFIMSGFVIAHSYTARLRAGMGARTYLGRRIVRLYPMFIAGLLLGVAALCLGVSNGAIVYRTQDILASTALNALYLPFLNTAHIGTLAGSTFPADPPAWSLLLEMLASGGFLLLAFLRPRMLLTLAAMFLLLTLGAGLYFGRLHGGGLLWLNTGWGSANILGGLPRVGFGFTTGVLLHSLAGTRAASRIATVVARLRYASLLFYAALGALLLCPKYAGGAVPLAVLTVAAPLLVFASVFAQPRAGAESHLAWFLGWISYPVYCLHYPVLRLVHFSAGGHDKAVIAAISAVATLAAAVALTRYYDEPVRAALTRSLSRAAAR